MKNLKSVIRNTWQGDVTFAEATENLTATQLRLVEAFLSIPKVKQAYKNGIPFPSENPFAKERAAILLQSIVDELD